MHRLGVIFRLLLNSYKLGIFRQTNLVQPFTQAVLIMLKILKIRTVLGIWVLSLFLSESVLNRVRLPAQPQRSLPPTVDPLSWVLMVSAYKLTPA